MKENWGDKVVQGVEDRLGKVTDVLSLQLKDTKPFDKEPVDMNETYYHYRRLTPLDMTILIQKHGREKVNDFLHEMSNFEQDKRRRLGG